MHELHRNLALCGSHQATRFVGNAQSPGAQWLSEEGLAGKILVEHLAGKESRFSFSIGPPAKTEEARGRPELRP